MNEDQKYFFDVAGYLVLEDLLTRDHCEQLIEVINRIAGTPVAQLPKGVSHSIPSPLYYHLFCFYLILFLFWIGFEDTVGE